MEGNLLDLILKNAKEMENFEIDFSDQTVAIDERIIVDKVNNVFTIAVKNFHKEVVGYLLADLDDLEKLKTKNFNLSKTRTPASTSFKGNIPSFILDVTDKNAKIVYKNGNKMDIRKSNIKVATKIEARLTTVRKTRNEYRGISTHPKGFRTIIMNKEGSQLYLGAYTEKIEAAKVYDMYALHMYGKVAPNNSLLTEEEIDDILKNGIPKKYQRKAPKELPKHIHIQTRGKGGYYYSFKFREKSYQQTYETIEEAQEGKEERIDEILEENPEYRDELRKFRDYEDESTEEEEDEEQDDEEISGDEEQLIQVPQLIPPLKKKNVGVKRPRKQPIPEVITEEFIESIKYVQELQGVVRKKKWNGIKGYFAIGKIKQETLKEYKIKVIELLRKETKGEDMTLAKKEKAPKVAELTLTEILAQHTNANAILTPKGLTIDLVNKYVIIPLQNSKHAIVGYCKVDLDEYDKVSQYTYHLRIDRHGKKTVYCGALNVALEYIILGKPAEGFCTFYDNSDNLDLRKENIRQVSIQQATHYKPKFEGEYSSTYKGVSKFKTGKYRATIQYNGKYIHIGTFTEELNAANAFDIYSVFYYGGSVIPNNTLIQEEIDDILENGIPDHLAKREDISEDIYMDEDDQYYYEIVLYRKKYSETFDNLQDAITARTNKIIEITDKHIEKLLQLEETKEIERNENGQAVIKLYDREGNYLSETVVSDETWMETDRYSWYLKDDGYVAGYVNGEPVLLHRHLHTRYKGVIPKGITVDHIVRDPLLNTLDNIRLATRKLQNHNRKKVKGSIIQNVKGVTTNGNKFVVNSAKYGRFSFEYLEDAAEKSNELMIKEYGKDAVVNPPMPPGKTTVMDIMEEADITEEYIKTIKHVELFKLVVKKKNWGGKNGKIKQSYIRAATLEDSKLIAIKLLREENQ